MVKPNDIKVVLPCLFDNTTEPLWMMLTTCTRFGIDPYLYGINETYQGWVHLKIDLLGMTARKVAADGYSHLLYVDARDAWFLTGLDEVADKYNAMGCPPVMLSAQHRAFCGGYGKWYNKFPWDTSLAFPYIGTPGILAEASKLADIFEYMLANYPFGEVEDSLPDDDPAWWIEYMLEHPGEVVFDHQCDIFANVGDVDDDDWEVVDGRAHIKLTDSWPCTIHYNGGASHWKYGKWEALEPQWRRFGYTEDPPWLSEYLEGRE